jgi:hypothetical protein
MGRQPEPTWSTFVTRAPRLASEFGVVGLVGGGLGGAAALVRRAGLRFWALALAAGGALTLGGLALQDAQLRPTGDRGGPAEFVVWWLVVGWLMGALFGVAGAAAALATQPFVDRVAARSSHPLTKVVVGSVAWSVFWGILTALLSLLAFGVILLSLGIGGRQAIPAAAVGASLGAVLAGAQWAVLASRIAAD